MQTTQILLNQQENKTNKVKIIIGQGNQFELIVPQNQNIYQIIQRLQHEGKVQMHFTCVVTDQQAKQIAIYNSIELMNVAIKQDFQLRIYNQQIDNSFLLQGRLTLFAMNFNWKNQHNSYRLCTLPFESSQNMMQIAEIIESNIDEKFTKISFFYEYPTKLIPDLLTLAELDIDEQTTIQVNIQSPFSEVVLEQRLQDGTQRDQDPLQYGSNDTPTQGEQDPPYYGSNDTPTQEGPNSDYQNNHFFFDNFSMTVDIEEGSFLVYKYRNFEGVMRKENGKKMIQTNIKYDFKPLLNQIEISILNQGFIVKWPNNTFNSIRFDRKG